MLQLTLMSFEMAARGRKRGIERFEFYQQKCGKISEGKKTAEKQSSLCTSPYLPVVSYLLYVVED